MSTFYPIVVDYDMAVKEAVRVGSYDYVDKFIPLEDFPIEKKGKEELVVELIYLDSWLSTEEALKEIDRIGYRPVNFMELLAFGARYPEVQREFTVVALGSMYKLPNSHYAWPTLHWAIDENRWLCGSGDPWYPESRFAVVCK